MAIGVKPEKIIVIPNNVDSNVFHSVEKDAANNFPLSGQAVSLQVRS